MFSFRCMSLVFLCLWSLMIVMLASASSMEAPVRNLEPSWAASSAQGTAITMKLDDAVILFLRSPASGIWRPPYEKLGPVETISGLQVTVIQPGKVQFAPPWLAIGPQSLCAMTGLASDAEHLCRVLQKQVDSYFNIYNQHLTTHSMAMGLADTFQQETFSGGRPFGIQCLLIGGDDIDPDRVFGVYSIDPTGSWQSWGGTTAIGKYAKSVREELAKKRQTPPTSLREALEQIVDCWMETCKNQKINLHSDEEYHVLILRRVGSTCQVCNVDDGDIRSIVDKIIEGKNQAS